MSNYQKIDGSLQNSHSLPASIKLDAIQDLAKQAAELYAKPADREALEAAARQGDREKQFILALILLYESLHKDTDEAAEAYLYWLTQAANNDHAAAAQFLAVLSPLEARKISVNRRSSTASAQIDNTQQMEPEITTGKWVPATPSPRKFAGLVENSPAPAFKPASHYVPPVPSAPPVMPEDNMDDAPSAPQMGEQTLKDYNASSANDYMPPAPSAPPIESTTQSESVSNNTGHVAQYEWLVPDSTSDASLSKTKAYPDLTPEVGKSIEENVEKRFAPTPSPFSRS